ncbi:DUF1254 domain-containing protein, partial [Durusdinium trenchii]
MNLNRRLMNTASAAIILGTTSFGGLSAQDAPTMKMTTEIPEGITTPDNIETQLGDLNFFDGVPDFDELMDSTTLFLTANTTSVYQMAWLQLDNEPMVIETPPDVLGFLNDAWFKYVVDFGNLGPDEGAGGKFLILPPGFEGEVPEDGYTAVVPANTFGHWVLWRGYTEDGSGEAAVMATQDGFRMYPLSQADNPPEMTFVNVSGREFNTIHVMDERMFEEINTVIQSEPPMGENPEILGHLAAIGI